MEEMLHLTQIILNVVLIFGAIAGIERGIQALDQWLREKRGIEKYDIGRTIGRNLIELVETIHLTRSYGWWTEDHQSLLEERKIQNPQLFSVRSSGFVQMAIKLERLKRILKDIRRMNLDATLFDTDIRQELEEFEEYIAELDIANEIVYGELAHDSLHRKEQQKVLYGGRSDEFGTRVKKAYDSAMAKITNNLFKRKS